MLYLALGITAYSLGVLWCLWRTYELIMNIMKEKLDYLHSENKFLRDHLKDIRGTMAEHEREIDEIDELEKKLDEQIALLHGKIDNNEDLMSRDLEELSKCHEEQIGLLNCKIYQIEDMYKSFRNDQKEQKEQIAIIYDKFVKHEHYICCKLLKIQKFADELREWRVSRGYDGKIAIAEYHRLNETFPKLELDKNET